MIFEFNADERRKRRERMELVNGISLNTLKEAGKREGLQQGLEEGLARGLEQGLEQGLQQGLQQVKKLTAKKLKEENISIDVIIRVTGLTKEEIELL